MEEAQQQPRRKSNSYRLTTLNPSTQNSLKSSLQINSRQTKTFIVEEQQEEESKTYKDEEDINNFNKAHDIIFENSASHRAPFEVSEGLTND